jgi:hypothetical protein
MPEFFYSQSKSSIAEVLRTTDIPYLALSWNELKELEPDAAKKAFNNLSSKVKGLKFGDRKREVPNNVPLAAIFSAIPNHVELLALSKKFGDKTCDELAMLFRDIPETVKELELITVFQKWSQKEQIQVLARLPANIQIKFKAKEKSRSRDEIINSLGGLHFGLTKEIYSLRPTSNVEELVAKIKSMPIDKNSQMLGLDWADLFEREQEPREQIFAAIPTLCNTLYLYNFPAGKSDFINKVINEIKDLPAHIDMLYLPDLNGLTADELIAFFAALPKTVKMVSAVSSLRHLSDDDLSKVLKTLPADLYIAAELDSMVKPEQLITLLQERSNKSLKLHYDFSASNIDPMVKGTNLSNALKNVSEKEVSLSWTNFFPKDKALYESFNEMPKHIEALRIHSSVPVNVSVLPVYMSLLLQKIPSTVDALYFQAPKQLPAEDLTKILLKVSNTIRVLHLGKELDHFSDAQKIAFFENINRRLTVTLTVPGEGEQSKKGSEWSDYFRLQATNIKAAPPEPNLSESTETEELGLARDNLLDFFSKIISNNDFWYNKVRFANHENRARPRGVNLMAEILNKNTLPSVAELLKQLQVSAEESHSEHYQWAHRLFRGRNDGTNVFYSIAKKIDPSDIQNINERMKELHTHFSEALPQEDRLSNLNPC